MATLTVGSGAQYATIQAAVAASHAGDIVDVNAGSYINDFISIYHDLTIEAVGGPVYLVATAQPPNGKGIIDAGGPGVHVTISGLDISGATVPDENGAGIRYEGGTLDLRAVNIHDNQNGILANGDPNGVITVSNSTFAHNGFGDGRTHDLYIGNIASLTVQDSTITSANIGHEIKSRAATTNILRNFIADGPGGNSSYQIDLPQGGVGVIQGNIIQKSSGADNPVGIAFGEESGVYAGSSLSIQGNTIITDYTARGPVAIWNAAAAPLEVSGNAFYGWATTVSGPAALGANTTLTTLPALATLKPAQAGATLAFTDTATGQSGNLALSDPGTGGPSFLHSMYIWASDDAVAISTATPNTFLKGGAGGDALQVSTGQNVLDGGTGSNFLVGGTGNDTFFTDARGGAVVWSTIVNFHAGDAATLWGFVPGTSTYEWDQGLSGAPGYEGATLRAHIDGSPAITASMTFAGMSVAQAQSMQPQTGTAGGAPYLYFAA